MSSGLYARYFQLQELGHEGVTGLYFLKQAKKECRLKIETFVGVGQGYRQGSKEKHEQRIKHFYR